MVDMSKQIPLFTGKDDRPKTRVPISKEKIKEVQDLIAKGDGKTAAQKLRDLRYGLENYERRLNNK